MCALPADLTKQDEKQTAEKPNLGLQDPRASLFQLLLRADLLPAARAIEGAGAFSANENTFLRQAQRPRASGRFLAPSDGAAVSSSMSAPAGGSLARAAEY